MADEDESKLMEYAKAAKNLGVDKLAEKIYVDGLKGGVQELGKSITTLSKAINVALSPVKGIIWSYEQIESLLTEKLNKKLSDVPSENIVTPPISVAGPAIEALRFTGDSPSLQDMFAQLLASSMNKETQSEVHPAFVEMIKQLSTEEANLLNFYGKFGLKTDEESTRFLIMSDSKTRVPDASERFGGAVYTLASAVHPSEITPDVELYEGLIKELYGYEAYHNRETDTVAFDLSIGSFHNLVRLEVFKIQSTTTEFKYQPGRSIIKSKLFLTGKVK